MSNPLADLDKPGVFFCVGTNMTECHPVAANRLKRAVALGARLVVADPRRTELAEIAHLYLPIRVGSDAALLLAMAHVIAREKLVDEEFMAERTTGGEKFLEHVREFTPEWAETTTQVPAKDIETAAIWYGEAEKAAIYYTLGVTEHICGVENVQSICNLALMTGNLGKEGCGVNPLRGQNNVQGAGDSGALPGVYPGFQPVTDPANRARFKEFYGREIDLENGMTKVGAIESAGDLIRAMLIVGENTLLTEPDRRQCQRALESLDHLVVVDIFLTDTAKLADVVLPATSWAETDGSCTNTERRVQRVRAAVPPPGDARPDWGIIAEIAKRMGFEGFEYESPREVFNELCSVSPIYAGLDWNRIDKGEFHWPVPDPGHPGTPILHRGEFKNGRGIFTCIRYRDPAETVSEEFPVWLTTGRRLESYHTRTQTGRSAGIDYLLPEETLEVHPRDVAEWGLTNGGWCRVTSRRGEVKVKVQATRRSPRGTVFLSFSFSDVPVNLLTGSGYDPATLTAELKVCPVRIEASAPGGFGATPGLATSDREQDDRPPRS